jgi:hypothetical protein
MRIVNHIGGEYSQWYIEMVTEFKELVSILYFLIIIHSLTSHLNLIS